MLATRGSGASSRASGGSGSGLPAALLQAGGSATQGGLTPKEKLHATRG